MTITPRHIFEVELPRRLATRTAAVRRVNAVIAFDIRGAGGGTWTLDATGASASIAAGADGAAPRMTLVATDTDFVAIATGKLDAVQAVMRGQLKLKPFDMTLALKLGELLA